jgi:hypothetical protein
MLVCVFGLAAVTGTGCGQPPAHPCRGDFDCALGWLCLDAFCEPASSHDAGADDGDVRDAAVAPEIPDRSSTWNYVFVTSEPIGLPFDSLAIADGICDVAAATAGLPGSYRAWLSTTQINAMDRLQGARGWILTDGRPFADTVDDIVNGRIFNPPAADEYGLRHDEATMVFTGTIPVGTLNWDRNCSDWSTREGDGGAGYRDGTTSVWTEADFYPCQWLAPIYCFGIDKAAPLNPTPAEGNRAWLSTGPFRANTGVAGADAICAGEAAAAGLTGNFKALIATSTSSAADRFTSPIGTVWVRPDGIPLNPPGVDLFTMGAPVTPLNVTLRGQRVEVFTLVYVGSPRPRDLAALETNCNDWSTSGTMNEAFYGDPSRTTTFFYGDTSSCNAIDARVYCLED